MEYIIESKNPELYTKRITDKFLIGKKYYISPENCLEIMKQGKSKKCKQIVEYIAQNEDDKENIIDPKQNIFQFEGHKFLAFFVDDENVEDNWQVWIKGGDVSGYLKYSDCEQSIRKHVENQNKMSYSELLKLIGPVEKKGIKSIDKKTIFINLSGFFNLIHESKKPLAKRIKSWLDNEVLPALVKNGAYSMQPKKIKIKFFYDYATFADYDGKPVLYISYVGKYKGEYIFKYGCTRNVFRREYTQHRKQFEIYQVVFIAECLNCEDVETLFENELKLRYFHRKMKIKDKKQKELFTISTNFSYEYFIELMKKLIETNKPPAIKEAYNKMAGMQNVMDTQKQFEELRKLELQFRLSDNYKLELDRDVKIKQLDTERDIAIKQLDYDIQIAKGNTDIELQREKNKQIAMENNYDLSYFNVDVTKNKTKPKKNDDVIKL